MTVALRACALLTALVFAGVFLGAAQAAEKFPFGRWRVADGTAIIKVYPCGGAVCGAVAAAPPPQPGEKSAVGIRILIGLRPDGEGFSGKIYNLDNGQYYDGSLLPGADADHLKIRGCVAGGGLCGGETWRRVK